MCVCCVCVECDCHVAYHACVCPLPSLSEEDTVATSSGSSKNHVYGTRGFRSGKVAWEFLPTRDSNGDECSCFGCGTKPVLSGAYDGSQNLWMIRAYNGCVYVPGSSSSRPAVTKIHQVCPAFPLCVCRDVVSSL